MVIHTRMTEYYDTTTLWNIVKTKKNEKVVYQTLKGFSLAIFKWEKQVAEKYV